MASTADVDLVADIKLSQVDAVTSALTGEFYVDADMIRDAVKRRASFNVVHFATMFKADIFVFRGDSFSREEMARARTEQIDGPDGKVVLRIASPEDTVLQKLIWYKRGNQISDRQWADILGVLKVQGEMLDRAYIDRWAPLLDILDLLLRATKEQQGLR